MITITTIETPQGPYELEGRQAMHVEEDTLDLEVHLPTEDTRCRHCGEPIVEYGEGWEHEGARGDADLCGPYARSDADDDGDVWVGSGWEAVRAAKGFVHVDDLPRAELADQGPAAFVNWCGIQLMETEVRLQISTGTPQGCFQITVRRDGEGRLRMSLPYPGEAAPHEPTHELFPGTLVVGR